MMNNESNRKTIFGFYNKKFMQSIKEVSNVDHYQDIFLNLNLCASQFLVTWNTQKKFQLSSLMIQDSCKLCTKF